MVFVRFESQHLTFNIFADSVADVRHNLATPKLLGKSVQDGKMSLSDLLDTLNQAVVDQVKAALHHLQVCLLILMSHSQCLIISVHFV